jgi:hypothetical protein
MSRRLIQRHVNPLMIQRPKDGLHPSGADLSLHQRITQLPAVDRAVSLADTHQLLKSGVSELGWHLDGWNYRGQG